MEPERPRAEATPAVQLTADQGNEPSAPPGLRIGPSPGRGRGVFAARAFAAGEVIERAAVLVFPRDEVRPLAGTLLDNYWFWWDDAHNAVSFGCGSLYNHDSPANARFVRDTVRQLIVFVAARAIASGEEITINYGGDADGSASVWFNVM